ncbi:MAG: hypothetical protein HOG49_43220 [Candidatus Scalindua sp.]|jgi:hypothetical protein|nr:hypothetical protein [Candidatus Scalindua sp.]
MSDLRVKALSEAVKLIIVKVHKRWNNPHCPAQEQRFLNGIEDDLTGLDFCLLEAGDVLAIKDEKIDVVTTPKTFQEKIEDYYIEVLGDEDLQLMTELRAMLDMIYSKRGK